MDPTIGGGDGDRTHTRGEPLNGFQGRADTSFGLLLRGDLPPVLQGVAVRAQNLKVLDVVSAALAAADLMVDLKDLDVIGVTTPPTSGAVDIHGVGFAGPGGLVLILTASREVFDPGPSHVRTGTTAMLAVLPRGGHLPTHRASGGDRLVCGEASVRAEGQARLRLQLERGSLVECHPTDGACCVWVTWHEAPLLKEGSIHVPPFYLTTSEACTRREGT